MEVELAQQAATRNAHRQAEPAYSPMPPGSGEHVRHRTTRDSGSSHAPGSSTAPAAANAPGGPPGGATLGGHRAATLVEGSGGRNWPGSASTLSVFTFASAIARVLRRVRHHQHVAATGAQQRGDRVTSSSSPPGPPRRRVRALPTHARSSSGRDPDTALVAHHKPPSTTASSAGPRDARPCRCASIRPSWPLGWKSTRPPTWPAGRSG